jgi:acetylornithine/N-succinyldiaminopimelate aminotransferase
MTSENANKHIMPTYNRADLRFERGDGAWLISDDGQRYLDFGSGVAVNALGHAHPKLIAALNMQAEKLWHVSNLYNIPEQEKLADMLCAKSFAEKVFFCNSGAEAAEGMIKVMRRYHADKGDDQRVTLISFAGAFHGRTLAALAAAGNQAYLQGFGPAPEGFKQCATFDIADVEALIDDTTAGILIEPVQGEGGVRDVGTAFLRALRALCDKHGILLGIDEVQTGIGRTGKLFAHEWADITPDVMAIAKGIGGGFPLGAFLTTAELGAVMQPGTHGSTFGGNPLACAVGSAVLEVVCADGFLDHVLEISGYFRQQLAALGDTYPHVFSEVRGKGLLTGLKCVVPNMAVVEALRQHKLLSVGAGENTVRFLPPLIVTQDEIKYAVAAIDAACAEMTPAEE